MEWQPLAGEILALLRGNVKLTALLALLLLLLLKRAPKLFLLIVACLVVLIASLGLITSLSGTGTEQKQLLIRSPGAPE